MTWDVEESEFEYNPKILCDLREELGKVENKSSEDFFMDGEQQFSVNEILEGVDKNNELGRKYYRHHVVAKYREYSSRRVGSLSLREISLMGLYETEAKKLGIDKKV